MNNQKLNKINSTGNRNRIHGCVWNITTICCEAFDFEIRKMHFGTRFEFIQTETISTATILIFIKKLIQL